MIAVVSNLLPRAAPLPLAQVGIVQQSFVVPQQAVVVSQIDVDEAGTPLRLDWPRISGATEVALDFAQVTLTPPSGATAGLSLGHLKGGHSGTTCVVPIAGGPRVVRSLYLSALRLSDADGDELPDFDALRARPAGQQPLRIAVAVKLDGVLSPIIYAYPRIAPSPSSAPYAIPPLLDGATYANYSLTLPDVLADEVHLQLVTGSAPEDFSPVGFKLKYVSAQAAPSPLDVALADADEAPFYTGVGPVTGNIPIDAKNAVRRALEAAIATGADPSVELSVSARIGGKLGTTGIVASGEVRRVFADKISATLSGTAQTPPIPGAPLDSRAPDSATADLVIDHAGLRLHDVSDPVPALVAGQDGQVLSMDGPLWHAFPPAAMQGDTLRRIGIIGYGLEAASLSLRVLEATPDGSLVAPPDLATATCDIAAPDLTRPQQPQVFWFDLGDTGLLVDRALGIEVTAQSGRFLWITSLERKQVQLAVTHDLTGNETVTIGSQSVALTGPRTTLNQFELDPANFTASPVIDSAHFLTLTLSRLTLGYAP